MMLICPDCFKTFNGTLRVGGIVDDSGDTPMLLIQDRDARAVRHAPWVEGER